MKAPSLSSSWSASSATTRRSGASTSTSTTSRHPSTSRCTGRPSAASAGCWPSASSSTTPSSPSCPTTDTRKTTWVPEFLLFLCEPVSDEVFCWWQDSWALICLLGVGHYFLQKARPSKLLTSIGRCVIANCGFEKEGWTSLRSGHVLMKRVWIIERGTNVSQKSIIWWCQRR